MFLEWINIESVDEKVTDSFSSGNELFDEFLKVHARRWQDCGEAATYIIADAQEVINNKVEYVYGYVTLNTTGLLKRFEEGSVVQYLPCVEIRMFAIDRSLRKHGDPYVNYSDIIFNLVLMNLWAMSVHMIGFKGIFLNANHEGERLYRNAGFEDVTEFVAPTEEDKIDIKGTTPMLLMINDEFIDKVFSPIE